MRAIASLALCCSLLAFSAAARGQSPATEEGLRGNGIAFTSSAALQSANEGQYLYVRGQVLSIVEPLPNTPPIHTLLLTDPSGLVRVEMMVDVLEEVKKRGPIAPGMTAEVYGRVTRVGDERRIAVERAPFVRASGEANRQADQINEDNIPVASIGSINMGTVGMRLRVRGTVVQHKRPKSETETGRLVIEDETGTVSVLYPGSFKATFPADRKPEIGSPIEIAGEVREAEGNFSMRVRFMNEIRRPDVAEATSTGKETPKNSVAQATGSVQ